MKGSRPTYGWVKDSELERGWIAASPNGWTDNEIGRKWIEAIFDAETKEKCGFFCSCDAVILILIPRAAGDWRCIVLDSHESHINEEFIEYALTNNILIISLAPHTSGETQPLDKSCYRDYQQEYSRAAERELCGSTGISKRDFPR